jgi:hypothetical protein
MARTPKRTGNKQDAKLAFDALVESGIVRPDVTIADLLKATRPLSEVGVEWTVVVDSGKWGFILK